ncbi:hypothetical protein TRV_03539 [Trichophyton verrucosum HKI 0517]|uniref:Uncharacterized protein n=1 Tax=Trichophyton verrucosum (strain HKI 0517) TaxID=663202 RepID=D4D8V1_TRIVH|nr:uncharacterized protein TRV_03539 [Trichophyton verrucosum HKI 0517]EFE41710.1 hypothetical protein TRV_03539 [Trichophyton verrucosum HKI 0517]
MTLPTPFTFLSPSAGVDDEDACFCSAFFFFSLSFFLASAGIKVDYIIGRKWMFRSDRLPDHVSPAKPSAYAAAEKGRRSQKHGRQKRQAKGKAKKTIGGIIWPG